LAEEWQFWWMLAFAKYTDKTKSHFANLLNFITEPAIGLKLRARPLRQFAFNLLAISATT
jgi:hypothetical protein